MNRTELVREATRLYGEGRLEDAIAKFSQGLSSFRDDETTSPAFADFCGNYGSALAETGDLKGAEWMFNAALAIYLARRSAPDVARIHFNLGNVYRYMNSRQACADHYHAALDAYRACGDPLGEGICLASLATHFTGIDAYDLAREQLARIDALPQRVKDDPEFAWSWRFQQAKLALHDGDASRAEALLTEALGRAQVVGNRGYVEQTESALAQVRLEAGHGADALPALERAYEGAKARHDRGVLSTGLELARSLADTGDVERASVCYEEVLDLVDRGRGELDGAQRFHWMEQLANVSQAYAWLLHTSGRDDRALEVSERGQGRALLDLMFRHQLKLQGGRSVRATGRGRVVLDAPTLAEMKRAAADARTAVLKLLGTTEGTLAWFLRPDGELETWQLEAVEPRLARALGPLMWSGGGVERGEFRGPREGERAAWADVRGTLANLYEALLPERIRGWLEEDTGRLLVIPHHAYFGVPWGALGPLEGPPLGVRWEIGVAPSMGTFMHLDRRRDPEPWRGLARFQPPAVALGDCGVQTIDVPLLATRDAPRCAMRFSSLPGTGLELQRVIEILDGVKFVGTQAHVAAVRATMGSAGVLHLATHGYWNPISGDVSFLVLAPSPPRSLGGAFATGEPGALFAYQLMGDDFRTAAELVTLSGCQTGLGTPHPDTYISLASSFLVAGARSVLVSLWPIRDDATIAFMEEFYGALREGTSPAAALRRAQAEMAESSVHGDGWNWSGFEIIGNPFHALAPDAVADKFPGPAFCGGDLLWTDATPGASLPLQAFADRRQSPGLGWIVRGGEIQ